MSINLEMSHSFDFLKKKRIAFFNYTIKKHLLGCFLVFSLFSTKGLEAQAISFDNTVSPEIEICAETKSFSIAFTNNTSATLTNVSVNVQLPSGIHYENGSLNNVNGGGVQAQASNNPEAISFSVSDLVANSTISFDIALSAHFAAHTFHTGGGIFRNTVTINYSDGSETVVTDAYNILYPALTITKVESLSATAFVGQTFTRKVTIVNGGYGKLSSFVLTDTYDSNLQLTGTDKGVLNGAKNEISFSASDFASIGDNDGYFEQNESIIVTQVIIASGCNDTQSSLQAFWGCDGQTAASNIKYPYTTIKLFAPNLSVNATPSFNTCVDGTADIQKVTLTNNGTGPANQLEIDVRQEPENIYSAINPNTLRYSIDGGASINIAANLTREAAAFDCLNNAYVGGFQVTIPPLQPGETAALFWDSYTCDTESCGDVRLIGWEYEVNYTDMCFKKDYQIEGEGQEEKRKNFTVFYESPSDLVDQQTGEYVFLLASATFNLPEGTNPYFEVAMDIPQGLVWSGDNADLRYVSGTNEWIPTSVNFDTNTRKLTAQYPFPIPITLTRSEFRLKLSLDCSKSSSREGKVTICHKGNTIEISENAVDAHIAHGDCVGPCDEAGNCPENFANVDGLATVGMQLFYIMDSSCPNPYRMRLTCYETPMTFLHCPGLCSEGLSFQSFEIERTNFGKPDNDIDGLPDNSGTLNFSKIKINRVMMSDTFKTVFKGKILTSAAYPSWGYAYANSRLPIYGDKLQTLSANVTITDESTGNILTANNVPFTTQLSGTTLSVNTDFSAPTLSALGNSAFDNFVLENDDEVEVEIYYTLAGNIGGNIEQVLVTNDFYVAPTANGTPFQCNDWSGNVTFVGYFFTTYKGEQYDINTCTKTISQNYYLSIGTCCSNYAGGDFFPYEYRNWAVVEDLRVEIPTGFSVSNASMKYYRTAHVNNVVTEELNNLQPTVVNGQEYTYDLAQYFTSQGGNLNLGDDGFNGTVYLEIDPDCQAQQNKDLPVIWNYRFREVDKLGGGITSEYNAHTDYIKYIRGDLRLTTTLKTVEATNPTVSWEVKIRNRAVTAAPNSWFYIENPSNILTVFQVEEISTGRVLTPVNGFYQLGEIASSKNKKYRITANSNECIPGGISTYTGYSCEGYPTDFASINCDFRKLTLAMTPQISELQTRVREIYDPLVPCDPVFGVELELLSSKLAAVKDIIISIVTPNNGSITIVGGSTEVLYPQASSFTSINDPSLSGNTYTLTGADIDAIIGTNGLVGITDVSGNIAKVRFEFTTEANFEPGDFLQFNIASKRSCGDPLPTLSMAYDPNAVFAAPENIGLNSSGDNWAASWGDYNGDGNVDLFITTHDLGSPNELFKNNGDGTFTKITTGPIATDKASSLAASWADYDNDQDLDLIVANNIGSPNFLYRNEGGGNFIRMQNDPIVNDYGYAHGVSWVDYDKDGFLDLFVASFFATQFNSLYHNNGDGTFIKSEANSVTMEASSSTCGAWGDYNNDGLIDLFVANTYDENNSLYENKGNGNFLKINAGAIVNDGGHSVGASWADYDNDSDLDLFVSNAANEDNFLYQNNGNGTFTKITTGIVVNDGGHSHGSSWADYDNDGWIDLFVANDQNQDNNLYKNNKDGTFTKIENAISQSGGMSFGAAWADYDNDGGVDLFVANRADNENFLYQNVKGACQSKSCITLVGTNSNQSAIGAKIYVKATIYGQAITQMREITAQSGGGIGGQNELKAIFGLGDAGIVEEIKVVWPSGYEQVLTNQMVDDCLVITEENASKVCGIVYHDENENCIQDENEVGIANQKILLAPGNHVVFTDEEGRYEAYVPIQNYDIIAEAAANWALSCPTTQNVQQVDVPEIGQAYCGFDFGIKATCLLPDLNVESAVTAHRIGFKNLVSVTYKNEGTVTANNVVLALELDPYCIPLESTIPWDRQEGQTLYWDFSTIGAGTKQTIYLTDSVASSTPIGQELVIESSIGATEEDCNSADNAFRGTELAIGALDPNDILVSPEGAIDKDEVLTYKIRFQNIGNIPVANVSVTSTLPKELDKYTFELGVGSHAFRFEQQGSNLTWEFPNIMLADSVHNEPESHGFVIFRILPKADLPIGTIIENQAKIFFDNMEPIATNIVENIIQPVTTTAQFGGQLLVYPNPTDGLVNIQLLSEDLQQPDNMRRMELYNTQGVLVKSYYNMPDGRVSWDLAALTSGLYYLTAIDQKGAAYNGKILVQR